MSPTEETPPGAPRWTGIALTVLVVAAGFQLFHEFALARMIEALRADVAGQNAKIEALSTAAAPAPTAVPAVGSSDTDGSLDDKVDALRTDLEFMVNDIQRIERKLDDLTSQLENRGVTNSEPPQPPELDWTEPSLFEAARKGADSVGFALTKDEVRCPSRLVLHEGALEYFAVLKGGKEHETLVSLLGNTAPDARRAKDMAVKLNNALQALGFHRGTPIRFTPMGTQPAQGDTVYIYIEWTTGGQTEIVRAEDLVWHRVEGRPMARGSWVYVGSLFVPGEDRGTLDYAADLTAEVASTYSAPSTMIDNIDTGAQDDTVFLVASPRIPDDVTLCTVIFRKTELTEGVKEFPPVPTSAPEDGGDTK